MSQNLEKCRAFPSQSLKNIHHFTTQKHRIWVFNPAKERSESLPIAVEVIEYYSLAVQSCLSAIHSCIRRIAQFLVSPVRRLLLLSRTRNWPKLDRRTTATIRIASLGQSNLIASNQIRFLASVQRPTNVLF